MKAKSQMIPVEALPVEDQPRILERFKELADRNQQRSKELFSDADRDEQTAFNFLQRAKERRNEAHGAANSARRYRSLVNRLEYVAEQRGESHEV